VKQMDQLHWSQFTLPNGGGAFYVGPKDNKDGPVIVYPHGGPHSLISTVFFNRCHFFNLLGFTVLFVNYRGSIGYGKEVLDALPGHVGDMDVKDCISALNICFDLQPNLSRKKVFAFGGSHGGFLSLHLAGQYPDTFKGIVAINPVTNIASNCGVTDIPDWCFNETGLDYAWKSPQPADYQKMFLVSPIAHIEKIQAPILLQLGSLDLRVPPSQGLSFYHALKGLGKEVSMHEYEDNHSIKKPQHSANLSITSGIFFKQIIQAI